MAQPFRPSPSRLGERPTVHWGLADDGHAIEIEFEAGEVDQLVDRWPPIGLALVDARPESVSRRLMLEAGASSQPPLVLVDGHPSTGGWDRLESELALFAAERLKGLVAVHAAVVSVNGVALVLPGESGVGKSTFCIAAAAGGATVLTDEYALVDPSSGRVTGWNRPVRMRHQGGVERLALAVDSDPLPVGLVAVLRYDAEAGTAWSATTSGEAVVSLMANTVCARSRPDDALDAALAIARTAQTLAGTRGEASESFSELADLLDAPGGLRVV